MSDELFPSGLWTGFYNYTPPSRHRMEMNLDFKNGRITGDGRDDIGLFLIKGGYDVNTREASWLKTYVGSHDVFYRGYREGKGIWGAWDIGVLNHGGFHIWPRAWGDGDTEAESAEQTQPADAVATELQTADKQ